MSRILFINSVCNGSTGTICKNLYKIAESNGHKCCIAFGRGNAPENYNTIRIGNKFDIYSHVLLTRLFDIHGFGSKIATKRFIKEIEKFNPDIIHLHNLHGYYINVEILFDFFKKRPNIKVIWTLHDCWSFTGHCAHFIYSKCNQWQKKCEKCSEIKSYPNCLFLSNTEKNFIRKKRCFQHVENLTIVTPSKWLAKLIDRSFLSMYSTKIINNGVDLSLFKNNLGYEKSNKKIILGVANVWNDRKGYLTFLDLSSKIDNDQYEIIMVGLTKKQISCLPANIIGIERTTSVSELVELYSRAYVFFNPTLEDNYPTVNLEAQACGTPVVTFDVGGCSETIFTENSFIVNNVDEFVKLLKEFNFNDLTLKNTIDKKKIDQVVLLKKYIDLYEE